MNFCLWLYITVRHHLITLERMATPVDPTQKLTAVLQPMITDSQKAVDERIISTSQEVLIAVGKLHAAVDLLAKQLSEKKKPVARGEKKADDAAVAQPANGEPVGEQPTIAQAAKKFPNTSFVWFRNRYRNDAAFREKYVNAELRAILDNNQDIKSKAKEEQRLMAEVTVAWNHIKTKQANVFEAINKEYETLKAAHNATDNQQQAAEAHTPEVK